jgi:hypothetical protein
MPDDLPATELLYATDAYRRAFGPGNERKRIPAVAGQPLSCLRLRPARPRWEPFGPSVAAQSG